MTCHMSYVGCPHAWHRKPQLRLFWEPYPMFPLFNLCTVQLIFAVSWQPDTNVQLFPQPVKIMHMHLVLFSERICVSVCIKSCYQEQGL